MHGLAYDAIHDEVVVPVALGAAVLTFRGSAHGEEPPIRTIQGPNTHLVRPHTLAVDEKNGEIIVADLGPDNNHSPHQRQNRARRSDNTGETSGDPTEARNGNTGFREQLSTPPGHDGSKPVAVPGRCDRERLRDSIFAKSININKL